MGTTVQKNSCQSGAKQKALTQPKPSLLLPGKQQDSKVLGHCCCVSLMPSSPGPLRSQVQFLALPVAGPQVLDP